MKKITRDTIIADASKLHPEVCDVLLSYSMRCAECPIAGKESLEDGARAHGLGDDEINKMIGKLNELLC